VSTYNLADAHVILAVFYRSATSGHKYKLYKKSTSRPTRVRSEFLVNVLLLYRKDYLSTLLILNLLHVLKIVS